MTRDTVISLAVDAVGLALKIGLPLLLVGLIVGLVISSVLMSMGMMMLPPIFISLPFKILLFVLVDGWSLVTESLVKSFTA